MRLIYKLLQYLLSTLLSWAMLSLFSVGLLYIYYAPQLPDKAELHKIELQVPMRIYSREKRLIAQYGEEHRKTLKYDEIPTPLVNAFIAIEDYRFYEHKGVDFTGIMRALYNVLSTGNASQGASTITMQLARNVFFDNKKTIDRKLRESLLALKLEETLSKQEILELYLNKIYLGNRAYGVGAAAETYYGKKVADLTLAQHAMIAGLPKAPSIYNPIVNPKRAMQRRNYILQRLFELGYIKTEEYKTALAEPNTARVYRPTIETQAPYIAEMVRAAIVEKFGQQAAYTHGYNVYTTLDSQLQQYASQAIRQNLLDYDRRHGYRGPEAKLNLNDFKDEDSLTRELESYEIIADQYPAIVLDSDAHQAKLIVLEQPDPISLNLDAVKWAREFKTADQRGPEPSKVNQVLKVGDLIRVQKNNDHWELSQIPRLAGALVLMNPKDGAIQALMGGFDYTQSKFNRATQASRQPGSSFKPVLYTAAMTRGYNPTSIVNDAPITITMYGKPWQPQNYGGKYIGPTTLAEALAKSRNLVSVRLTRSIGIDYTVDYATRFGFSREQLPRNYTLSLGTAMTNPLQMTAVYSAFANGGFKVDPYFITRIENERGETLFEANPAQVCGDKVEFCPPATIASATTALDANANTVTGPTPALASPVPSSVDTTASSKPIPAAKRIIDSLTHYKIVSMLQGVTQFGTAASAGRLLNRKDIGGKTGTTNDQKDAWFRGISPHYVAVAWAGFDDMKELGDGETGTRVALPMWLSLMTPVLANQPEQLWTEPKERILSSFDIPPEPSPTVAKAIPATPGQLAGNAVNTTNASTQAPTPRLNALAPQATTPKAEKAPTPKNNTRTARFEYKSVPAVAPKPNSPYNRAEPNTKRPRATPAPTQHSEAVEIPEQIF